MNSIISILLSIVIIAFVAKPQVCIFYTLSGAKLFFYSVFPSLFPFLVICNIIISYGGIELYSRIFGKILCKPLKLPQKCSIVLIISFMCGYPLGAKYACDLYQNNEINYRNAQKLLNIASNASPIFIIGALGTSMLKNTVCGYIILFSVIISCFIIGLIYREDNSFFGKHDVIIKTKNINKENKLSKLNPGQILKESIENAIKNTLIVAGFVIIFSVITGIINNAFSLINYKNLKLLEGTTSGLLEMTNGCSIISSINTDMIYKIGITAFLITFSGLSVILQVYSIIYKHGFSLKKYIKYKFYQGIIAGTISMIIYHFAYANKAISVFSTLETPCINYYAILYLSLIILIIPVLIYNLIRSFHVF